MSAHLVFFFSLSLKYQILKFHFKTKSSCVCLVSNGCTVFYMFECHKSSRKSNDIFCEYFLFPGNKHTAWKLSKYIFFRIRTEYLDILQMRENTNQKKLRIWTLFTLQHFWRFLRLSKFRILNYKKSSS